MENEDDMSTAQGRKVKSESYSYSWFLPAPGSSGSVAAASTVESLAKAESSQTIAMETLAEWRRQGETKRHSSRPGSLSLNPMKLRLGGFLAWNAIAITGAVIMSMKTAPIPGVQLGIFGGVWIGISALIWFLPGLLGYRG